MLLERKEAAALIDLLDESRVSRRQRRSLERLASTLIYRANQRPAEPASFVEAFLAAYLMGQRSTRLDPPTDSPPKEPVLLAAFDILPFDLSGVLGEKSPGASRRLTINDREALIPLYFRDALVRTALSPVLITSISFGCVNVEYQLNDENALADIRDVPFGDIAADFRLKSLVTGGEVLFRT